MPHGPDQAVNDPTTANHGPGASFGGGGKLAFAGWPDNKRERSGPGPFGPNFTGVWQSLQPAIVTRYFPWATRAVLSCGLAASSSAVSGKMTMAPSNMDLFSFIGDVVVLEY